MGVDQEEPDFRVNIVKKNTEKESDGSADHLPEVSESYLIGQDTFCPVFLTCSGSSSSSLGYCFS